MKKELEEVPQTKDYLQYTPYRGLLGLKRLSLIVEQVLRHAQQKQVSQLRVLELGCGIGLISIPLSSLGCRLVGVDIDSESISLCNSRNTFPNAAYVTGNAETLDLQEEFDVVIASELIEHGPHPHLMLQALARHLIKGGIGIVSVPNGYSPYELVFNRIFQKLGLISLFYKLPRRVYTLLTGSLTPCHSINAYSHHVQFFSFGGFVSLLDSSGFQVSLVRNLGLGLLLDWTWFSPLRRIECTLADFVPHPLAGGWIFVINRKDE